MPYSPASSCNQTKPHAFLSFQDIILNLQKFWSHKGCVLLQSYDMEMGAGTFHPGTTLRILEPRLLREAFVQLSRRPGDGRYGRNPNRVQKFHQFQVLLKPSPNHTQSLVLDSFEALGIDLNVHDVRFVEDDWESPTLGASGVGWEVWIDGMEVLQYTYFQQMGGIPCRPVTVELTYGLERMAMVVQHCDNFYDILWNSWDKSQEKGFSFGTKEKQRPEYTKEPCENPLLENPSHQEDPRIYTYKELFLRSEVEFSKAYFEILDPNVLRQHLEDAFNTGYALLHENLVLPAYEECVRASHLFNLLDSRGSISVTLRASEILRIRKLAAQCCEKYVETFQDYETP